MNNFEKQMLSESKSSHKLGYSIWRVFVFTFTKQVTLSLSLSLSLSIGGSASANSPTCYQVYSDLPTHHTIHTPPFLRCLSIYTYKHTQMTHQRRSTKPIRKVVEESVFILKLEIWLRNYSVISDHHVAGHVASDQCTPKMMDGTDFVPYLADRGGFCHPCNCF